MLEVGVTTEISASCGKYNEMKGFEMPMRWTNVFGLMFLIFCIYLFIKAKPFLNSIFEDLADGYYYHNHSPVLRVAVFGLICVTIVAVVKILSER